MAFEPVYLRKYKYFIQVNMSEDSPAPSFPFDHASVANEDIGTNIYCDGRVCALIPADVC